MLQKIFQGMSLVGSESVLWLLVALSILSISIIIERVLFYQQAQKDQASFRDKVRNAVEAGNISEALTNAKARTQIFAGKQAQDFDSSLAFAVLSHSNRGGGSRSIEVLSEIGQDMILQTRLKWEKNLSVLATIGSNAPFIGLFGTVLGIIQAFHDLSQKAASGPQTVTAGISEALVATAVGILVAIPAVVAFNLFQRKVKSAVTEADAFKSFLVAKISSKQEAK